MHAGKDSAPHLLLHGAACRVGAARAVAWWPRPELRPERLVVGQDRAAKQHITGGKIYDGLILRCAMRSKAETIYTWNAADFSRLAPELGSRIRTP